MAGGTREYAVFPMSVMNITQGMESGTHAGSFAIDIAGRDSGKEWAFAPFTGVIKKKYANGNTVWLESVNPVEYADGSVDYMTVAMTHDNNIDRLKVGQVINQGVNFYQEGTAGNATGNHIHLGVGRGKFSGSGWYQNKYGYWVINNEIRPYDAFYLSGTEIINGGGYPWKTKGELMAKFTREQEMTLSMMAVGSYPGKDYNYQFTVMDVTSNNLDQMLTFWASQADGPNGLKAQLKRAQESGGANYSLAGDLFGETYYRKK